MWLVLVGSGQVLVTCNTLFPLLPTNAPVWQVCNGLKYSQLCPTVAKKQLHITASARTVPEMQLGVGVEGMGKSTVT